MSPLNRGYLLFGTVVQFTTPALQSTRHLPPYLPVRHPNPARIPRGSTPVHRMVLWPWFFIKPQFVACHFSFSPPFFSTYVRVRALRRPCPSDFRKHFGRGSAARGESEAAVLQFTQAPFPLPL